jgi:hypothetical protein
VAELPRGAGKRGFGAVAAAGAEDEQSHG